MRLPPIVILCAASLAIAQAPTTNGPTTTNWQSHGGSQLAWRYSALGQVNVSNVSKLAPAWIFQTGDYEMTVFADGRAIIKGTADPGVARSVYARYIG